jgi:RimJ/RimL family protein N-acetyltransferase
VILNLSKKEIEDKIKAQIALEFNCSPEDFDKTENVITAACLNEKRRKFSDKSFFLQMATFGKGTVISADESIHPWLTEWVKGKQGMWLFEQHNYFELECELRKHGYKMALTHHMFMPVPISCVEARSDVEKQAMSFVESGYNIKWLEQKDIAPFYGNENFPNAICDKFKPERPDVLCVVAMDGDKIMGMAGCSADTPQLWQIGIDVLPEYRGRGVAKTLVTLLKNETFRRGAIPYYGTSLSNLASWKTALECGFRPLWVEAESQPDEKKDFAK